MRFSNTMIRGALVACLGAAALAAGGIGSNAYADNPKARSLIPGSAADPFVTPCRHPLPDVGDGFCMYTSVDLGIAGSNGGKYAMDRIRVAFSKDGVTWQDQGVVLTEDMYRGAGLGVPSNANHLWAPVVYTSTSGYGGAPEYFLLSSDVPSTSIHKDSLIGVSKSSSPIDSFQVLGKVNGGPAFMSNPALFPRRAPPSPFGSYMIFSDGDFETCGGLSIAEYDPVGDPLNIRNRQELKIEGISAELGKCTRSVGSGTVDRPFVDGPSIYDLPTDLPFLNTQVRDRSGAWRRFMLVFAAKPQNTPEVCKTALGQPNTSLEVIAYALGNDPKGPFTYQGIIMCGSSTEWTNHASLAPVTTHAGKPRTVLYFVDGVSGDPRSRKVYADCLGVVDGKILTNDHTTTDGLRTCMAEQPIVALRSEYTKRFVQANPGGSSDPSFPWSWAPFSWFTSDSGNGMGVWAKGDRIGWWEQFAWIELPDGKVALASRRTGNFVGAQDGILKPDRGGIRDFEKFEVTWLGSDVITLKSVGKNAFVTNEQNGSSANKDRLVADRQNVGEWEWFKVIYPFGK